MESSYAIIRKRLEGQTTLAEAMKRMVAAGRMQLVDVDDQPVPTLPAGELMIVLCPVNGTPGAKRGKCGCGGFVWMSPKVQSAIATYPGPHQLVCPSCMTAVANIAVPAGVVQ